MPGLPVHHQLLEFTETHFHRVSDAIQPSHPLLSPSPPDPNPSQPQDLFQWVSSSHEVAKVLEFQLQHQSFQWTLRTAYHYVIKSLYERATRYVILTSWYSGKGKIMDLVLSVLGDSVVSNPCQPLKTPWTGPTRLLCPWDSPGKNAEAGSHSLLQGIFPTQGLNPGLLCCRWILYHLNC